MKFILFVTALLFCNSSTSQIFTRTFRWTFYKDFIAAGWASLNSDLCMPYTSPIDMDMNLLNLNRNFEGDCWGGNPSQPAINTLILNMAQLPVYCGITNATLDVKLYQNVKDSKSTIYPVKGYGPDYKRPIYTEEGAVKWQTITSVLDLTRWKGVQIHYSLQPGELIVFDEITLTYSARQDEDSCPYYCNHDCEYRAIGCHYYYTCVDRMYKDVRSCSADKGLAFNPQTKTCDFKENVPGCGGPPPVVCDCTYKPHATNKSSYFYCQNSCQPEQCEERHCPKGLVWKPDTKQCDL